MAESNYNTTTSSGLASQNAELASNIAKAEAQNLTNYEMAQYRNLQVTYVENIIFVLNVGYFGLIALFAVLLALNYKNAKTARSWYLYVALVAGLIVYPFVAFHAELFVYSLMTYLQALTFGSVYTPPQTADGAVFIK